MRTGSRAAVSKAVMPPLDCITKMLGLERCGFAQALLQAFEVTLHHRLQIRIHDDGAGAFVLAEFGQDFVGDGKRDVEAWPASLDRALVRGIGKGKQQADGDCVCVAACESWSSKTAISLQGRRPQDRPSLSTRSFTPKRSSRGTSGSTRSKKKSYSLGRAWRPISMASSNPAVVTSATRAPLRCRSVLVPTVVPCSS